MATPNGCWYFTRRPAFRLFVIVAICVICLLVMYANYHMLIQPLSTAGKAPSDHEDVALEDRWDSAAVRIPNNRGDEETVPVYLDFTQPWDQRVENLISRMSTEEVIAQSYVRLHESTPRIKKLGVRPFSWSSNCPRGGLDGETTSFPVPVAMAATFSSRLNHEVAVAMGDEVRGAWNTANQGFNHTVTETPICYGPSRQVMRDPVWGDNQWTYGEDPYMVGVMASSFVRGFQGNHSHYIRAAAVCSGNIDDVTSSLLAYHKSDEVHLKMTFLPPLRACVEAGAVGVLCSDENKGSSAPSCGFGDMSPKDMKDEVQFKGSVICQCDTSQDSNRSLNSSNTENVIMQHQTGCNIHICLDKLATTRAINATNLSKIEERRIRQSIEPLFKMRMRLGEFDPRDVNPYASLGRSEIQNEAHRKLAETSALKSFVLLKNTDSLLPLQETYTKVAIFGPAADNATFLQVSGRKRKYWSSPLSGLRRLAKRYVFERGCDDLFCRSYNSRSVGEALRDSDLVIYTWAKEHDHEMSMDASGKSLQLLQYIVGHAGGGVPIIALLFNGFPFDISWALTEPRVSAILECFLPGQSAGNAIYRVLTNADGVSSPAGRLPFTWPKSGFAGAPSSYSMTGRTYRYLREEPLLPFGFGLSYTVFSYSNLRVKPPMVPPYGDVTVHVTVSNTGTVAGDEVVQFYMKWDMMHLSGLPSLQLVGFERIHLVRGMRTTVSIVISRREMLVWVEKTGVYEQLPGTLIVFAGGHKPGHVTDTTILQGSFRVLPTYVKRPGVL